MAALIGVAARGKQQHRHTRVGRGVGDDGVGAQVRLGGFRHRPAIRLAQANAPGGAVQAADIREQVVGLPVDYRLARGAAAAIVLVGEALGFEQFDVRCTDGHASLQA